ncbi:MAG: DUF504 domain-containing protein [Nanoarchaeota archaeon]
MYIGDLLNKIRWDKNLKPEEYLIVYFDRIAEKTFEVPFVLISRKGNFFIIKKFGQEVNIPLHRIRQVKRNEKVVWER